MAALVATVVGLGAPSWGGLTGTEGALLGGSVARAKLRNARARRLAGKAMKLYKKHRYGEALTALEEAYKLDPDGQLHWAMGRCAEKLGELPAALDHYERFLEAYPDAPNKGEATAAIAYVRERLRLTMARLEVVTTPPGASVVVLGHDGLGGVTPLSRWLPAGAVTVRVSMAGYLSVERHLTLARGEGAQNRLKVSLVTPDTPGRVEVIPGDGAAGASVEVDGAPAGTLPRSQPLELTPGTHTLRVTREGFKTYEGTLQVAPGQTQRVDVALDAEPILSPDGPMATSGGGAAAAGLGPVSGGVSGEAAEPAEAGLGWPVWATGGAGLALSAAGATLVGLGFSDAADAREATTLARHDALQDQATTKAVAGYATLGVGLAAVVGAVVWAAVGQGGSSTGAASGDQAAHAGHGGESGAHSGVWLGPPVLSVQLGAGGQDAKGARGAGMTLSLWGSF